MDCLFENIIGLVTLGASLFANFWQYRVNRQTCKKNKEYEKQLKQAIINVEFFQTESGDSRFRVCNDGLSDAHNISLSSPDIGFISQPEDSDKEEYTLYVLNKNIPISKLDKGGHLDFFAIVFCDNKEHPSVDITWDDDFSNHRTCTRVANALFGGRYSGNLY